MHFITLTAFLVFSIVEITFPLSSPKQFISGEGIYFKYQRSAVNVERFEEINILLPYPNSNRSTPSEIVDSLLHLQALWATQECNLFAKKEGRDSFSEPLLAVAETALAAARLDSLELRTTVTDALQEQSHDRGKRQFMAIGLGVGLLSAAVVLAPTVRCFLSFSLGPCDDEQLKINTGHIDDALRNLESIEDDWISTKSDLDSKFFILGTQLTQISRNQRNTYDLIDRHWNTTLAAAQVLTAEVNRLADCTGYLYYRTEINHMREGSLALLSAFVAQVKSFRSALYAFKQDLLNALVPLSRGELPLSILPVKQLQALLTKVVTDAAHNSNFALAVPIDSAQEYYSLKIVRRLAISDIGLIITLALPLTSTARTLDIYSATPLPMAIQANASGDATAWLPEGKFLAISPGRESHTILTEDDYAKCVGSASHSICSGALAIRSGTSSCLAALFVHNSEDITLNCDLTAHKLPSRPTLVSLSPGVWSLQSRSPHFKGKIFNRTDSAEPSTVFHGCKSCTFKLKCGMRLSLPEVMVDADPHMCDSQKSTIRQISLTDPLLHLFSTLPLAEQIGNIGFKPKHSKFLKTFQQEVRDNPPRDLLDLDAIAQIAEPLANDWSPTPIGRSDSQSHWSMILSGSAKITIVIIIFIILLAGRYWYKCKRAHLELNPQTRANNVPRIIRMEDIALEDIIYKSPPYTTGSNMDPQLALERLTASVLPPVSVSFARA